MPFDEFETLYWQIVSAQPSVPQETSFSFRARKLAGILGNTPACFTQQLVRIIVLSARSKGQFLNEPATLQECYSQLLQVLPAGGEFLLYGASTEPTFTEIGLKTVLITRLAWRLLFNPQ